MSVKGTDIYFTRSLKCIREQHACSRGLAPYTPPASSSRDRVGSRGTKPSQCPAPVAEVETQPQRHEYLSLSSSAGVKVRQPKCSPATHNTGSPCGKAQPGAGGWIKYIRTFIPTPKYVSLCQTSSSRFEKRWPQ